ncbi:sulfotransferase family 2 domain-containing protein [Pseudoalteromonas spongiae]|uniref:sulfotransferase family 2 domain-containing protein n=1 Tax=Pseudoalteromonas spongiae TaxID=298657 RepID=UPI00110A7558|nr:sulfotransferase family 2 domain-containing protein [Pseudoalteromonas spongiae]TMO83650.1 hypothetical protein CWC15_14425 [Pseudoalteromonas spongiae]
MIVSLHIPKTAGTTIGYILDYGTKRKIFYDYTQHLREGLVEDINYLTQNKEFIEKRFEVVHGHFHYKKYSSIFPNAKFITCLRDPLKRTVSQYHHIIQEADPNHWLYERLSKDQMDIVEFASLPNIRRAQSLYMEGREVEDYDHIALTENLAESIYQFQVLFNFQRNDPYMALEGEASIPNTNPATARTVEKKKLTDAQLAKVKEILHEDYDLYERAKAKFNAQAKLVAKMVR